MKNFGAIMKIRELKENIEMFVDKQRFPDTIILLMKYMTEQKHHNGSSCIWKARSTATLGEHRVQSGILFTQCIHTRGTFAACRIHVRVPKKTERMLGSSIQKGRLARLRGACLIDQPAQEQKNRQEQSGIVKED